MKLGDIINEKEYKEAYKFAIANGYTIELLHENGDRLFQIKKIPSITERDSTIIRIHELKKHLEKCKEDVEQVELFGMERTDYEEKKKICSDIILELRVLEKSLADIEVENGQVY